MSHRAQWLVAATAAIRGAMIGAAIGAGAYLVARPAWECRADGFGCIGPAFAAIIGGIGGALLLGWILSALLRLDNPWSVAFAGVVLSVLSPIVVRPPLTERLGPTVVVTVSVYSACAALFSRASPRWLQMAAALVVLAGVMLLVFTVGLGRDL